MTQRLIAGRLDDLPPDTNRAIRIGSCPVLLCRTAAGVFAVENRCTHQLQPLLGGRMRGVHLFCPAHSARFDMRTGATVGTLAKGPIQTYPTTVDERGNILIEWDAPVPEGWSTCGDSPSTESTP